MKAEVTEDMTVPKLENDGTFSMIMVKKGSVYKLLSNYYSGPICMTLAGIILPVQKVLTRH